MLYSQKIQKAIRFSLKTHEVYQKQKRKGKDIPYITHPLIVGLILAQAGASEDVTVAGILHDTMEDSIAEKKVSKEMIADRFGGAVADIVESVTEPNKELSWEERKDEAYRHIVGMSHDSLLVKSADLISNVSELIADYKAEGDAMFSHFNAPKEKIVAHYLRMIGAIISEWKENPLAGDLQALDVMSLDLERHSPGADDALWRARHAGEPMAFVSTHGKTRDEIADEVLHAAAHPSHRMVSFSGEEYIQLAKIIEPFSGKGVTESEPKMVLVMGGVASGKTTLRRQRFGTGYVNFEYGEIHTAVRNAFGEDHPRLPVYVDLVCDAILRDALTEKKNLVVEIIGDEYDKLVPVIDRMKSIGYKIEIIGLTTDPVESYKWHLKAVKEDPDYISAHFTQDSTLAYFYSYFELPNNPGVGDIPKDA